MKPSTQSQKHILKTWETHCEKTQAELSQILQKASQLKAEQMRERLKR